MAISPCLGCGLTLDESGNLIVDGVVSEVWPHSCDIATANGLRCDSVTNKLWTDPPTYAQWNGSSRAHLAIPVGTWVYSGATDSEDLELANPSDCFSMEVLYVFTVAFGILSASLGSPPAKPQYRIEVAFDGDPWAAVDTISGLFVTPSPGPITDSEFITSTFLSTVAPSGTARMRVRALCDNGSGGGTMGLTIGQINFTLRMFGVSAR